MKKAILVLLVVFVAAGCCTTGKGGTCAQSCPQKAKCESCPQQGACPSGGTCPQKAKCESCPNRNGGKVLRHLVLVSFKEQTPPARVQEIVKQCFAMKDKLDMIKGIEGGQDISPEKRAQGYTHCFIITFADEAARDAYLPSAVHQDFVNLIKPDLDKLLVMDVWSR